MRPFFITSCGTGIGKTLVTTALILQLRARGKTVMALKPVASGYEPGDAGGDTALIVKNLNAASVESVSPWRYAAPLSPDMAAAKEGKKLDFEALVAFCKKQAAADVLLVEGIGGVMVPLDDRHTVLDWMEALGWPAIVVAGSYLGSLSHTLTALEALKTRSLQVRALIVSESENSPVSLADTAAALEKFVPGAIPIVKIPRLATKENIEAQVPSISRICDA